MPYICKERRSLMMIFAKKFDALYRSMNYICKETNIKIIGEMVNYNQVEVWRMIITRKLVKSNYLNNKNSHGSTANDSK